MPKILVPYDGSPAAQRAVDYVIKSFGGNDTASVLLLNVQEPPVLFGDYVSADLLLEVEKGQHVQGQKLLVEAAEKLSGAGLKHQGEVLAGSVADVIVHEAAERACDMIVMGTRGMGSLGNLLLGSVATKVIHGTELPVTLIK